MKLGGLRGQILLVMLAPLAAFAPATVLVIHDAVGRVVAQEIDARGEVLARDAAISVVDDLLTGDRVAAEKKLSEMATRSPGTSYVFAVDGQGRVAAHTFPGGFPADLLAVRRPAPTPGEPWTVLMAGKTVHDRAAPILDGMGGEVHVGMEVDAARFTPWLVLFRLSIIGLAVVVSGIVLTLLMSERMIRRLGVIASVADAIGEGRAVQLIGDKREDEIGRVARAVDQMSERLERASKDRERTFLRMAHAEKLVAVGRLAAGVAHEINNPLSGVVHCLDNLDEGKLDERRASTYRELMRDGIGRAQRVVKRLLDYAKEHELEMAEVVVPAVLGRSLAFLQPSIERAHVRVVQRVEPGLRPIQADPHLIEQVLTNLVLNGIEAMPEGGLLEIECSTAGAGVRIAVRDHGTGIPASVLPNIFDPFFTTKGGSKGSGLGLSVSLGIVERHGGKIEVQTSVPGGTTFLVYLPFEPPRERDGLGVRREP